MKKFLAILVACTITMSLVACGNEDNDNDKDTASVTDTVDSDADDNADADTDTNSKPDANDDTEANDDTTKIELPDPGVVPTDSKLYAWQIKVHECISSGVGYTITTNYRMPGTFDWYYSENGVVSKEVFYIESSMNIPGKGVVAQGISYSDGEKSYEVDYNTQKVVVSERSPMVSPGVSEGIMDMTDVISFEYSTHTETNSGVKYVMEIIELSNGKVGFIFNDDGSLFATYHPNMDLLVYSEFKEGIDLSKMKYHETH